MMSFNAINSEANYYTEISKKTGKNNWNQDKFQAGMIEMTENLNLSQEQLIGLLDSMVKNNVELDMEPSYNPSKNQFKDIVENKINEFDKGKSMIQ